MKRRELIFKIGILSFFAAAAKSLFGCSVSNDPIESASAGNCLSNGATTMVGSNHGHPSTSIPAVDVINAVQKQYTIADTGAGHTHTFTVAAGDFINLSANTPVVINTDPDGGLVPPHTHQITINCS